MQDKKRILIAPLDWGLGHAARCVPIIRCITEKGGEPVIAADSRPLEFLKKEFPQLQFISFPGYNIAYPEKGSMALKMIASAPRILRGIREEHKALQEIVREQKIDAVISDNRFGLWTKQVPCVFITHQLMIKSPLGEGLIHWLNKSYIDKYGECWVPDNEGEQNLSGDLSHKYTLPPNAYFIGPLSRFSMLSFKKSPEDSYDLLVLLSGPEPQRTIFEKMILEQLHEITARVLIVQGKPEASGEVKKGNITIVPHLDTGSLLDAICSSSFVLSRPGYSTVMDLAALQKKAVFVPTPGQTEQEYLGALLMKKGIAYCMPQSEFNLDKAIEESRKYKGFGEMEFVQGYEKRIEVLLKRVDSVGSRQ